MICWCFPWAISKHLYSKTTDLLLLISLVFLLIGCGNTSSNEGFVWLGDSIITDRMDENAEPIGNVTEFDSAPTEVYCYLTLRGPVGVKMIVRWYYEDQLIVAQPVDFAEARKAIPELRSTNGDPLPPGHYRCEYSFAEEPARSAEFTILK